MSIVGRNSPCLGRNPRDIKHIRPAPPAGLFIQKVAMLIFIALGLVALLILWGLRQGSARHRARAAFLSQVPQLQDELTVEESIFASDNEILHVIERYEKALENPEDEDAYQKAFIKANCESRYSIYEIIHVVRQKSITLKDILRGHKITIHEKLGSETLKKGYVIMARIVTINEDSIACGICPQALPPHCLLSMVEFKQNFTKNKFFTDGMLFELDLEIRTHYLDLINELNENPFPKLQNTDGDEFSMHTIYYSLSCSPLRAFEALAELAEGMNQSELAQDGVYNSYNQLIEISFPWCVTGNNINKDWSNTVYGHITIKDNSLVIEVNSAKRAKAILEEINTHLSKEEATYLHTTQKSIQDLLKEPHESLDNPCDDSPEIQAILKEMNHQHWVSWLDTEIPALNHVTPRKAAKTAKGRELLDALFVDFHNKNQSGFSQYPVNLHFLRQELGMT